MGQRSAVIAQDYTVHYISEDYLRGTRTGIRTALSHHRRDSVSAASMVGMVGLLGTHAG